MEISIGAFLSIKTKPPKVGYRLLNHVFPTDAIGNTYFGFTIRPKCSRWGENLRSGTRINCAPEQRFGNFVPGSASLSKVKKERKTAHLAPSHANASTHQCAPISKQLINHAWTIIKSLVLLTLHDYSVHSKSALYHNTPAGGQHTPLWYHVHRDFF